ncbi:hypothetical protein DLAC_07887 [Tieghemostelium lacteum]|uniref:RNA-binding region RNP-1 domain-containing protein n=1 Tax=Tieghemostelium lacteum TaxID=361077 RepID=A0A151ZAS4_TIELA|nr:hypothetical protein DLAC_07887 [Tieghemostelium lacteum]|eukprot:KYQ90994.1 hypothetical protein DLAC_07887 [Tieghemostelium lacteum]
MNIDQPPPPPPPSSEYSANGQSQEKKYIPRDIYTVWIGGTPIDTKEAELFNLFKSFGAIEKIKISDHCAFVTYEHPKSASIAVRNTNGISFRGHVIKVQIATEKSFSKATQHTRQPKLHQPQPPPPPPPLQQSPSIHHGGIHSPPPPPPPPTQQPPQPPPPTQQPPSTTSTTAATQVGDLGDDDPFVNRKLFLLQIGNESTEDLRNRFSKYGPIEEIIISQKNHAFVKFIKVESAVVAKRELAWKYKIQYDKREGPTQPFKHDRSHYYHPSSQFYHLPIPQVPENRVRDSQRDIQEPSNQPPSTPSQGNGLLPTPQPVNYYQLQQQLQQQKSAYQSSILVPGLSSSELLSQDETLQFNYLMENLKPSKDSIREAKDWILLHIRSLSSIIGLIIIFLDQHKDQFKVKLNVVYLLNDIIYFGFTRRGVFDQLDFIAIELEPHLKTIIAYFSLDSNQDKKLISTLLELWDTKQYFPPTTIKHLITILSHHPIN